ncbi:MAG: DUF3137 domain-containing protein [Acholeplasmataceae bacterium]|jgi:hypothetical protein|nr:DUF3137 domain-containing protein [Acholeplasmataceae bacterium]
MDKLQALEEKRLKIVKAYKKEQTTGIILLVIGIIGFVIGLLNEISPLLVIGIMLFAIAIYFFGKARNHHNTFRKVIKKDLITSLLEDQFESVTYQPELMINVSRINQVGLVKRPDKYTGEDYISGMYKGVKFEVSDVDLKERHETRDSNGNRTVTYETYFKGRWYIYTFERQFEDVLKVVEGRFNSADKRGLIKIETESIQFNKKYQIYASTQEYAFYHITSSLIEKLLELEALHRGTIQYCYIKNELHIGVNDRHDYMELSLKKPINEANLKDFMSDIDLIPAIINELRLDSQKFKR